MSGVFPPRIDRFEEGLLRRAMATSSCLLLLLALAFTVSALAAPGIPTQAVPLSTMEGQSQLGARQGTHKPTEKELSVLQERLGYEFKRINLLLDALTHSSFSEANNDVLHVLGSKSVQQAIALHLILENPDASKSELNDYITRLSNTTHCAEDALELGLDSLVMVGKGVEMPNQRVLSGAFNAIFGAITVVDGPTTATFAYWKVRNWESHDDDEM